jgi:cytochrome c biogenesis protein CcmG, thiol:disulfide interchange protein DsbE
MRGCLKLGAQALAVYMVGLLVVLLVWDLTHQPPPPKVGAPAPGFSLPRLDGNGSLSLRSFRGKTIVLNFFQSACYACKQESPMLERMWRQDRGRGLVVLGVDTMELSRGDGTRFVQAHGLTYPIVFDGLGAVWANSYRGFSLPLTYVLNREGRIVGGALFGALNNYIYEQTIRHYVDAALN